MNIINFGKRSLDFIKDYTLRGLNFAKDHAVEIAASAGVMTAVGCASTPFKPMDVKPDDTYLELAYNEGEQDSLTSRAEILDPDGKKKFVAEHTHLNSIDESSTQIGMNQLVSGEVFDGQVSLYGDTAQEPHQSNATRMAVGFRGKSPALRNLIVGGAIETRSSPSGDQDLFNVYLGQKIDELVLKTGYAQIDGKDTYQAVAHTLLGNVFTGVGGKVNTDGKGIVAGAFRACPSKKGESNVLEIKGLANLEGMVSAKAIFGTKSKKGKFCGFHDLDDNGVLDVSANVAELSQ